MAALAAIYEGTATISVPVDSPLLTTPTTQWKPKGEPRGQRRGQPRIRPEDTVHEVDPLEKGDEEERNRAHRAGADEHRAVPQIQAGDDGEAVRVRSEVARDLIQRTDDLLPLVGNVALATNLQLLKRDLSRCHDVLRQHPSESDFLSIVTLVESAMAQLKWKQYTRPQLEAIRQAFDIGYRQVQVVFEDYEKARALFSAKHVEVTPRIDLESLKLEEITDAQEG